MTDSSGWRLPTRVVFRFSVVYFGLYILSTGSLADLLGSTFGAAAGTIGHLAQHLASWAATHVFGVATSTVETGSGDRMVDWIEVVCLLAVALPTTALWSVLDRRRRDYVRLDRGFRVFVRFALGATLLGYGAFKVVPLQMPAPTLTRLLEPFGNFSPMGVLWSSIGASFPYERVVGSAEVAGAVLLFIPRTATLGALVCLLDLTEIFTLNLTYDVPVKLYSFHLLLLSAFLLAPKATELLKQVLVSDTRTRWATVLQLVVGAYLVGTAFYGAILRWHEPYAGGAAKPAFYGIWKVNAMQVNGQDRPPLLTDGRRWRWLIFQWPNQVTIRFMDDGTSQYDVTLDPGHTTLALASGTTAEGSLSIGQPEDGHLILDGEVRGTRIHADIGRLPEFPLLSRGFHWIQERPFNR